MLKKKKKKKAIFLFEKNLNLIKKNKRGKLKKIYFFILFSKIFFF